MAMAEDRSRSGFAKEREDDKKSNPLPSDDEQDSSEILPGAKISDSVVFERRNKKTVALDPLLIDFRRILQCQDVVSLVAGISNKDLLHAVVGLYDVSLVDMTPDVLYANMCDPKSQTVVLIRNTKDVYSEYKSKSQCHPGQTGDASEDLGQGIDDEDDFFTELMPSPATFATVFSDTDSDEESDSEDETRIYTKGIHSFIKKAGARRELRQRGRLAETQLIGVENRVVAAATYEKLYIKSGEKIVHLMLMSVRKRFRKMGIGKYLVNLLKDPRVVGNHDAVVVHAEIATVDFFAKQGFDDDIVLNKKWSDIADKYTNCTLMTYLPPYSGHTMVGASMPEVDLIAMDKDIEKWRNRNTEMYMAEVVCMTRMKQEIVHLRAQVGKQDKFIASLVQENTRLKKENEKLQLKGKFDVDYDDDASGYAEAPLTQRSLSEMVQHLQRQLTGTEEDSAVGEQYMSRGSASRLEPYDHGKDTADFYQVTKDFYELMQKDGQAEMEYEVKLLTKAILPNDIMSRFTGRCRTLGDPTVVTRLYYCASLTHQTQVDRILNKGFSTHDFTTGDYGYGLYFSKFPSKAIQFSLVGRLVLAEVGLGKAEATVNKDSKRTSPSEGFDSIITPGRLSSANDFDAMLCQEYIVFDPLQAVPLYAIDYTPIGSGN